MRLLLFGDNFGIPQFLRQIPRRDVQGIVGAKIRPRYYEQIKQLAAKAKIPFCVQPRKDDSVYPAFVQWVKDLKPDLIWVNSYSMLLGEEILCLSRLGGINTHGGLLPQYRGCNPIQWAILREETEVGVTLHEMTPRFDEGAIIAQKIVPLLFEDNWKDAQERIQVATGILIGEQLPTILSGTWEKQPQDISKANYCRRRKPEDGVFDWSKSVRSIYNLIRALVAPHPGAFYYDRDGRKVVLDAYLSPFEVALLKYSKRAGGHEMQGSLVSVRLMRAADREILSRCMDDQGAFGPNPAFGPAYQMDFQSWFKSVSRDRNVMVFVIQENISREIIGACQLCEIDWFQRDARIEILVWNNQGQLEAFGVEAIQLLIDFGFRELELERIFTYVLGEDVQAVNVYEKAGFVWEAGLGQIAFVSQNEKDNVVMSIGRES